VFVPWLSFVFFFFLESKATEGNRKKSFAFLKQQAEFGENSTFLKLKLPSTCIPVT